MLRLRKDELRLLASLESVDSISIAAFADEVILHKGKSVGMYISNHGVVLEPIYAEVMRFNDLIHVGQQTDSGVRYGAYSITENNFVVPILYNHNEIWIQTSIHRNSLKKNTDL